MDCHRAENRFVFLSSLKVDFVDDDVLDCDAML